MVSAGGGTPRGAEMRSGVWESSKGLRRCLVIAVLAGGLTPASGMASQTPAAPDDSERLVSGGASA
jgi:hypothetical protein